MRVAVALCALLAVALAFACRDGSGSSEPANATVAAAIEEARKTPVDEPMRQYARQLCEPMGDLLTAMANTFNRLESTAAAATPSEDEDPGAIATFFGAFAALTEPLEQFREDLEDIDPTDELEDAHQTLIEQIDAAIEAANAFTDGTAFTTPAPEEPTHEQPPGFESGLIQECGEDFFEIVEEFGGDFFGGDDDAGDSLFP
jgi:hypothetical protein